MVDFKAIKINDHAYGPFFDWHGSRVGPNTYLTVGGAHSPEVLINNLNLFFVLAGITTTNNYGMFKTAEAFEDSVILLVLDYEEVLTILKNKSTKTATNKYSVIVDEVLTLLKQHIIHSLTGSPDAVYGYEHEYCLSLLDKDSTVWDVPLIKAQSGWKKDKKSIEEWINVYTQT